MISRISPINFYRSFEQPSDGCPISPICSEYNKTERQALRIAVHATTQHKSSAFFLAAKKSLNCVVDTKRDFMESTRTIYRA